MFKICLMGRLADAVISDDIIHLEDSCDLNRLLKLMKDFIQEAEGPIPITQTLSGVEKTPLPTGGGELLEHTPEHCSSTTR